MKKSTTKLIRSFYALVFLLLFSSNAVNAQTYCTSSGSTSSMEHITFVSFSGIENTSAASGYTSYVTQTAQVLTGISYPITVKMFNSGGSYTEYVTVFIDWNQDGVFGEGEYYNLNTCQAGCQTTGVTGSISVPHTALEGPTRMRVIGSDGLRSTACGTFNYGEVEDYTVNVGTADCSVNFEYITTNDCQNETYTVTALLHDFGNNDFVSIAMTRSDGVPVFPVSLSSELPATEPFLIISDVPTGVTVTATIQTVDTQCSHTQEFLSLGCYCIPAYTGSGCNYNYVISNVSLSGETVDLNSTSVCSGPSAYAYYAALPQPDLAPGEPYTLNVSTAYTSQAYVQAMAWIDFNKDSEFTADEKIGSTNGAGFGSGTVAFNFTVPESVVPGENYRLRVRLVYGSTAPTWTACSSQLDGETEDYKVTILQLPDCEGTPSAGVIEADDDMYCPNTAILLTSVGASSPASGQVRVWQTSPIGADTWTDIPGASPSTYTYTSMDTPSDIRYKVTCTLSGQSDVSNVITLNLNPTNECYCTPAGTNASYYVNNFTTTGGIDNITNVGSGFSTGGYGDFTAMSVKQVKTESIAFTFVGGGAGSTYGFRIWVDWNQDGQFSATEEVAYSSTTYSNTHSGSITVPESAVTGITRMRIVSHWLSTTGDIAPCATNHTYGEFEDYSFEILPLDACQGTPLAGTQDETMGVCAFVPFTLEIADVSDAADGLTRIWQSSPAGQNIWTDIEGAQFTSYIVQAGIGEPTDFRFRSTCDYSEETVYSNVLEVTLNPGNECYCTPEYSWGCSGDLISNVTLVGESVTINNTTGCSPDEYADYTSGPQPDLAPGETYSLSVSTTYTWPEEDKVKAWIDYNQNGSFEPSELIATTGSAGLVGGTQTFEFTLPDVLVPGDYRLRVRLVYDWGSDDPIFTSCSSEGYGETEDYMVTIIDLDACTGTPSAGTPDETAFSVCPLSPFSLIVSDASDAANGLTRTWQSSPAGENDWTDIAGASARNYLLEGGIAVPTDFRYTVLCTNSDESDISGVIQVTLKPVVECYCTPTNNSNSAYFINNVTTTGALENLNRLSGFSPGGYGDYTATDTLIVNPLQTIGFSVGFQDYTHNIQVWADLNQNGVFEAEENVISGGTGFVESPFTGSFTVPAELPFGSYRIRVRTTYIYAPATPCGDDPYSEAEDYILKVIDTEECAGTPSAGTIANPDLMVCAQVNFTLSVSGATNPIGGIVRTWQSSPAGQDTWTDIAGAINTNHTITGGITTAMDYRFKVTCTLSEETVYSNVVEVSLLPANQCYCTPTYTYGCSSNDLISNVTLIGEGITINNTTTCSPDAYGNYTALPAPDLAPGNTYSISVSTTYGTPSSENVTAWIDYNANGFFDTDEEIANTNGIGLPSSGTQTFQFTIPGGLDPGDYRLRVRMVYGSSSYNACNNQSYGETEDYMVEIIELDGCTGTPTAGVASHDGTSVCGSVPIMLVATGSSDPAEGLEKVWQISPAGQNTWTDIPGIAATSSTFSYTEGITEPSDFRYSVTCTNSDQSDYTNVISLTLNPANECYCIPAGTNASYFVNDFSTTGGIENISNLATGFSPGGYGDFTSMTVKQVKTESVEFTAVPNQNSNYGLRIWVDWNQDGNFDVAEEVAFASTGYAYTHTGTILVPENAATGITRMRVVTHYLSGTALISPCAINHTYGEYEDYTFEVVALETCEGTPDAGVVDATGYDVCALTPIELEAVGASDAADGLTRIWQWSPTGQNIWTDIVGASSPTYTYTAGIDEITDFRYKVECEFSQETAYSDVLTLGLNPSIECYCIPGGTSASYFINNFTTTGGVENISNLNSGYSTGGYGDFTATHSVSQYHTQSVSFSAAYGSGSNTFGTKIWVDWNHNGVFETSEVVFSTTSYANTQTGSFIIPESAVLGSTRMRIGISYTPSTGPAGPCSVGSMEFEDYTIVVLGLGTCSEAIAGTVVGDTEIEVCPNAPFTLSVTGNSDAAGGLTRTWQSSPVGEGVWTDLNVASASIQVTGIATPRDYRYHVECENGDSDDSGVISVSLNPNAEECYCTPAGTNSTYHISAFSTTGGTSQNITNNNSGFSTGGYGDFTSMEVTQTWGGTVNFSATVQGGSSGLRIWVDWNKDGQFNTTTEVAYASTTYGTTFTGSFTVPAGAALGATRMRIVNHWLSSTAMIEPCETNHTYGEFEDYTFNISEPIWDCPDLSANIGMPCNDGNPETANDTVTANCECVGVVPPVGTFCESAITVACNAPVASYNSANSIATNTTACAMGSKGLWFKFEGTGLDITVTSTASFNHEMSVNKGTCDDLTSVACVDGSLSAESYTITESVLGEMYYVYVAHWSATGTTTGSIGISIACEEIAFDCPELEANIGSACDDNNENTTDDVITEDCTCAGTPILLEDQCGYENLDNMNYDVAGSAYQDGSFLGNNGVTWTYVVARDKNGDANGSGIAGNAIMLRRLSSDSKITSSTVPGGISDFSVKLYKGFTGAGDRQVELFVNGVSYGTSVAFDDFDAHVFTVTGIDVAGDVVIEIRNVTERQIIIDDITWTCGPVVTYDCPDLQVNFGDACDDGNAMTENDMYNTDCECVGTAISEFDCPDLGANVGDTCNDGNPLTENDVVTEDCLCEGTLIEFDCPDLNVNFGDACDDGNDHTENDAYNTDCECVGTAIIYDCPELFANVGDACSDDTIENGVVNDNCECVQWVFTPTVDKFTFTMYPNPAGSNESVTLTSNQSIDRYEILDITGKLIDAQIILNQNEIVIGLRNYSAGMYILKAYSGSNFSTQKMVVR